MKIAFALGLLAASVNGDMYLHSPRGSNNRLNEKSANRNNGNRMFDSQNNNRGGYNVGDKSKEAFDTSNPFVGPTVTFDPSQQTDKQYQMVHYAGSELTVEWTNQHGCGGREKPETVDGEALPMDTHKLNCNIVLQYMCDTEGEMDPAQEVWLRDGGNTNTPDATSNQNEINTKENENAAARRGHHESESWYFECTQRSRNKGLFIADQNVKGSDARYTRQNPNGNRRGLECPEERDYYPYWAPTPWRDIAFLTDDQAHCDVVLGNSQNNNIVSKCTKLNGANYATDVDKYILPIDQHSCGEAGGTWMNYTHGIAAPHCGQVTGWSRVNHLGNGRDGQPLTYNWTLPAWDALPGVKIYDNEYAKCIFRVRYNISTDDYAPHATNASMNENSNAGITSPVTENPTVDVGADLQGLRLAINTAQFGRTFQDRSHVFYIKKRPVGWENKKIWNLHVRGKRGNIVQTFPSVEYDFVPNSLEVEAGTLIHVQWTGSNTHNNGNPAGDGQAGDAGEGTGGTDRHNFVQTEHPGDNYPIPLDKYTDNIFSQNSCFDHKGVAIDTTDCAVTFATAGQFRTAAAVNDDPDVFSTLLNYAPASLAGGVVLQMDTPGYYHYMCTRNNNFSNRSQKGTLRVV